MTERISAALREKADGDVHVDRLLSAVHAGVRRRRRHRILGAACAVVAAAGLAAGGLAVFPVTGDAPATPARPEFDMPRPPLVEGAPTAVSAPSVLGSDPTLFHLDLTGFDLVHPERGHELAWSARAGYEDLRGWSPDAGGNFSVEASQSRDKLTGQAGEISSTEVAGLPAEAVRLAPGTGNTNLPAGANALRWEAAPGVWAQVVVDGGPEAAMRIAERVRLDRTFRCAVPFRLTGLPDRARVIKCETWFASGRFFGGAWVGNGGPAAVDNPEYYVAVVFRSSGPEPANETIGGRAVTLYPGAGRPGSTARIEYAYDTGVAVFYPFYTTTDDPFLRSLVPAFQPVTDSDPAAWPRSPLQ